MSDTTVLLAVSEKTLQDVRNDPHSIGLLVQEHLDDALDLDRAGPIIRYLLVKYPRLKSIDSAINGGHDVGVDITGEAIFRYFDPTEVADLAQNMGRVTMDHISLNFHIGEIAPGEIEDMPKNSNPKDELDYAKEYFIKLVNYYIVAGRQRHAMVLLGPRIS